MTEERFLKLRTTLSERIGSRRFAHTLGVESAIIELGERYLPNDIQRLRIAALLHDVTKEWPPEEQIEYCERHGIPLTPEERMVPRILHAKTGAACARREFSSLTDPEIATAIERHTTGCCNMTVFDELLYLADYIEPTRTYPECRALRESFFTGYEASRDKLRHLHATMRQAFQMTVDEVRSRGGMVFSGTTEAIEWLDSILRE